MKYAGLLLILCSLIVSPETPDDCVFVEANGALVIEAESIGYSEKWQVEGEVPGHSGEGYLVWRGGDFFNDPGHGYIAVDIEINTPGLYQFKWRSKIGEGDNFTEFNDTWLRFRGVSAFYAQKEGGEKVYAHGSGASPNPEGSGKDGWMKIYLTGSTDWTWSTNTYDNDPHKVWVSFAEPGRYRMELSARSAGHLIDRIALIREGVSGAESINFPTAECSR